MRRWVTLAALALAAAASFGLYQLKYDVVRLEAELERLNRDLIDERTAVRVLEAEWSYLNRPDRLQRLAAQYLELVPARLQPREVLDALPLRAAEVTPPAGGESAPPPPRAKPRLGPAHDPYRALLASRRVRQ